MIEREFKEILTASTRAPSPQAIEHIWGEIRTQYSSIGRYYHNLSHLENLLIHLTAVKYKIKNWPSVVFALVFHDVIYNPQKMDNEEKSAEFAETRLVELGVAEKIIASCKQMILTTKHHENSEDPDTNIFTDADLVILGSNPDDYKQYSKNIRKEYHFYPEGKYNKERIQVLEQFLQGKNIFKSDYFFHKFEAKARENIKNEIRELEGLKNDPPRGESRL